MSNTRWVLEDNDATIEVAGHKYATGDSGEPHICAILCTSLKRHVHIDECRSRSHGSDVKHIGSGTGPGGQDWITHKRFWARNGALFSQLHISME
jgi:hypothetical protein